jgi:putative ABC transport system substrate-binding protein
MKLADIAFATSAMRRREFIALLGASVTWPFAALAQEPGRTYRLGFLFAVPRAHEAVTACLDPARQGGFIEGQNLTVDYRNYSSDIGLLPGWDGSTTPEP